MQWGLAYAAGAWGLQQGLAYVSTLLGWPVHVQRLTGLALLIGLPIALVLAWYHGDRGQRQVTRGELAVLTLLFLLGGGVFWYFQRTNDTATVASTPPPSAPAFATDASIAVLPFVNMSADKDQEYFADGISEELLNLLAQVPELRVIARTSSFSFKGKDVDIAEIARKLNVANVLEGSVRKSGDTLRITAQLVRASDSSHLWSQTYDRHMTDVFKVQDEIASTVVEQLKIKLLGDVPKTKATDPDAYALFLQAREISRQYTASAFERAIGLYKQALEIDGSYAPAWLGLATTYCDQLDNVLRPADEGIRLAREATKMALLHDPRYALAHGRLGWIATYYDRDLAAGARHIEHALALEPDDPDIIAIAAGLARLLGQFDRAIALGEYLSVRDPVNIQGGWELGFAYFCARRFDDAIAAFRAYLRVFPIAIGRPFDDWRSAAAEGRYRGGTIRNRAGAPRSLSLGRLGDGLSRARPAE